MQNKVDRYLTPQIQHWLFKGKIIILYGARQVGKTTLSKELLKANSAEDGYFNCEIQSVQTALSQREPLALQQFIGHKKFVVFDEAQQIPGIGEVLKLLADTYPHIQIIATGSSSFELANRSAEPLTGRAITFELFPLSYAELGQVYPAHEKKANLEFWLRFGFYPEVAMAPESDARMLLDNLSSRYLYKDILEFENLKRPDVLVKLLQLLALQVGQLVSYHELANHLKISSATVERYIDLLEKAFVIFRLPAFSRNLRNEIGKKNKIFFYDVGIRNSIIQQYQPLDLRSDKGGLWENFLVAERLKYLQAAGLRPNRYFWRNTSQSEIDYLEEQNGRLHAFEFKYAGRKSKIPGPFADAYPEHTFQVIDNQNFESFVS
ncbi:MAG TPA: hypothetical protein DCF33_16595 [Saprospirales bacterium]|nr:hypothetical protein [Saprospirales bacterium]